MKALFIPTEEQNILINRVTEKYIRLFFANGKKMIKGPEILHFCDNPQINKFIFFQLHQNWNKYQNGLAHPHYDFQHEEVKKALSNFLSVLSVHIQISEQNFRPFVEKAVFNCISLLLSPEDTFESFYFGNKDSVSLVLMEKNASHFAYFDFILQGIILHHQNQHMPLVRKNVFLEKFEKAEMLAAQKGQSLENYRRELFRRLTEKDLFEMARAADGTIPVPELPPGHSRSEEIIPVESEEFSLQNDEQTAPSTPEPENTASPVSLADSENPEPEIQEAPVSGEGRTAAEEPGSLSSATERETLEAEAPTAATETPAPEAVEVPATEVEVAEKESEEPEIQEPVQAAASPSEEKPKTLADLFQQNNSSRPEVRATHISLDNIPIHKQFQFSQKIFLGNNVLFRAFVQDINGADTLENALKLLQERVITPNKLKEDDALLLEFIQIIRNRYQVNA